MLYLARGRDQLRPACAALLDGDTAGERMRRQIKRGGAHGKPTVSDDLVLMVNEWAAIAKPEVSAGVVVREPEDLVPVNVAVNAARRFAKAFLGHDEERAKKLTESDITDLLGPHQGSLWDALEAAFANEFDTSISKAGFAKELLGYIAENENGSRPPGVPALDENFRSLIKHLSDVLALARERETDSRRDQRLNRIVDTFIADHPNGSSRDRAAITLKRIDSAADDTPAGDLIHAQTATLRREFKLGTDPLKKVDDYTQFVEKLQGIRHLERLKDQGVLNG
jgi:hypothetical protein